MTKRSFQTKIPLATTWRMAKISTTQVAKEVLVALKVHTTTRLVQTTTNHMKKLKKVSPRLTNKHSKTKPVPKGLSSITNRTTTLRRKLMN